MQYVLVDLIYWRTVKSAKQSASILLPDCFTPRLPFVDYYRARNGKADECRQGRAIALPLPLSSARQSATVFAKWIKFCGLDWLYDCRHSPYTTTKRHRANIQGTTKQTCQVEYIRSHTPIGDTLATRSTYSTTTSGDCTLSVKRTFDTYGSATRARLLRSRLPLPNEIASRRAIKQARAKADRHRASLEPCTCCHF